MIAQIDPVAKRLQQLRGVGPMIATTLVAAVGDGAQFANGRQLAALLVTRPGCVRVVAVYGEAQQISLLPGSRHGLDGWSNALLQPGQIGKYPRQIGKNQVAPLR